MCLHIKCSEKEIPSIECVKLSYQLPRSRTFRIETHMPKYELKKSSCITPMESRGMIAVSCIATAVVVKKQLAVN